MRDDTARSRVITKRLPQRSFGAGLGLVGLAIIGLLVTACGGGSSGPGVASAAATAVTVASSHAAGSDSSGESSQSQQLQFAHCMRSHGVSDFPDPSVGGGELRNIAHAGVNTRSPTYQVALHACEKYTPEGRLTPAQSAADNAKGVLLSQCMRLHGVPNFPDPITGPTGAQVINLKGHDIDLNSPIFQAAARACQKIVPGSK